MKYAIFLDANQVTSWKTYEEAMPQFLSSMYPNRAALLNENGTIVHTSKANYLSVFTPHKTALDLENE